MTMTRPCRRITLHLSQIFLTLGLTFTTSSWSGRGDALASRSMGCLLVAVDDAAAGQVVRAELHDDAVLRQDADVVLAHLPRDVREHLVAVLQLHAEHRVGERLDDPALDLDGPVFLGHGLRNPTLYDLHSASDEARDS